MPYISTEEVKEKRKRIKKLFPDMKFSITKENCSSINVAILEAPFNMLINENREYENREYEQVNHFYIKEHYKDFPKIKFILLKIKSIISDNQRELVYDGDYGSVPNYYIHMSIGKWDKPFKIKKRRTK